MKAGTVIHGTLRNCDLIPALLDAEREHNPARYEGRMVTAFGPVPSYVQDEGNDSEWWMSEDAQDLLSDLIDSLDEVAPEGMYFGANVGNSSDFGFWSIEE